MSLDRLLREPLQAINIGLEVFAESLEAQAVPLVHLDWRPPAGDARITALLARLDDAD